MLKTYAPLALGLLLAGCSNSLPTADEMQRETASIHALMGVQVADWNAGDIAAFMTGYWQSDSLRFVSGNTVRRGWQETLARYQATYPDRSSMGELSFELYETELLSPDAAIVLGRFHLKRQAPLDDLTGLFTVVLRKIDGAWKIVHDHTSS